MNALTLLSFFSIAFTIALLTTLIIIFKDDYTKTSFEFKAFLKSTPLGRFLWSGLFVINSIAIALTLIALALSIYRTLYLIITGAL